MSPHPFQREVFSADNSQFELQVGHYIIFTTFPLSIKLFCDQEIGFFFGAAAKEKAQRGSFLIFDGSILRHAFLESRELCRLIYHSTQRSILKDWKLF